MSVKEVRSAHHVDEVPVYCIRFKYFKFNPSMKTTKWQSDMRPRIVNPNHKPSENEEFADSEHADDVFPGREAKEIQVNAAVVEQVPVQEPFKGTKKPRKYRFSPCSICGKLVKEMKSHMLVHSGEKNFPCNFCGKHFAHNSDRNLHENIHKGLKPYQCLECPSAFAHRKSLQTHKVTHTKSRNYECNICGKTYGHLVVLKKHLAAHLNDRRYECPVCNKKFLAKQVLRNHMLIHNDERPHQCAGCSKRFRRADSLQAHYKVHERETPYVCDTCEMSFRYQRALLDHIENEHQETAEVTVGSQQQYAEETYEDHLQRLVSGANYHLQPWSGDNYQF